MNNTKQENIRVFKKKDIAKILKVSVKTVDRKVAEGKIPAPRDIGGIKRWDAQEFRAWWNEAKWQGVYRLTGARHG